MISRTPWLLSAVLLACAAGKKAPPPPEAGPVDAVLASGRNLFLFDFSRSRYQKWPLSPCALADTLKGNWAASERWLALPAPSRPFTPVQAAWGPSGNFYLLDRTGKRLAQYDSNAQFLSSLPLPREIRDRSLDRLEVFRDKDGTFSFLDLGEGVALQYEEMAATGVTAGGPGGDWRAVNRVRLPVGLRECLWRPFARDLCCTEVSSANTVCFDKYFNARGPWSPEESSGPGDTAPDGLMPAVPGVHAWPAGGAALGMSWVRALRDSVSCGATPGPAPALPARDFACHLPGQAALSSCPEPPVVP